MTKTTPPYDWYATPNCVIKVHYERALRLSSIYERVVPNPRHTILRTSQDPGPSPTTKRDRERLARRMLDKFTTWWTQNRSPHNDAPGS